MKRRLLVAAAALLLVAATAHAGQNCERRPPEAANVQRALELAERTARALDASGAQVVVLARAGQDLGRYGLRWSHLGWAYRAADGPKPVWRVVHKLNHCGSSEGALYRQGLGEFFLDDLHEYVAAYAVPTAAVQQHLLPLLQDNGRVAQLHTAAYNMVAYPWAQTYQQSNQWAIETLALAEEPTATSRDRAQAWLRFKGYQPSTLHISALTRLGARVSSAHIAFDDHPGDKRFADRIETVTVDSVFTWLDRSGLAGRVQLVR
jgi:hypothetical protein